MVFTRLQSVAGEAAKPPPPAPAPAHHTHAHSHASASQAHHQAAPHFARAVVVSVNLLELPQEVLHKIFSHLKFKEVAHLRTVCRQMNNACGTYLNSSFQRLVAQMLNRFQAIKSKMPRRESARRNHPLACEFDVIETVHMRLALLQMTFGKHIERKYCCFFPGEILDEVYTILECLKVTSKLARPFKLDELFDLSTMAMEYFKEHMEPNLPEITYFGTDFFDLTGTFSPGDGNKSYLCLDSPPAAGSGGGGGNSGEAGSSLMLSEEEYLPPSPPPPQSNMVLRKRIHRIKQGMKRYSNQLSALRTDLRSCKRKAAWQQKQILEQQKLLAEQQKLTMEYASRLDENDKKNEETSRKFQTLLQELNKCRTELQYWRSKSPATTTSTTCSECGDHSVANQMQLFPIEQYLPEPEVLVNNLRRPPTVLDPAGPSSPQIVATTSASTSNLDSLPPVENPMSPKVSGQNGKVPGSPKARRPTTGEGKSSSSDEGPSKRSCDGAFSPQENKKRRIQRSSKPRKV